MTDREVIRLREMYDALQARYEIQRADAAHFEAKACELQHLIDATRTALGLHADHAAMMPSVVTALKADVDGRASDAAPVAWALRHDEEREHSTAWMDFTASADIAAKWDGYCPGRVVPLYATPPVPARVGVTEADYVRALRHEADEYRAVIRKMQRRVACRCDRGDGMLCDKCDAVLDAAADALLYTRAPLPAALDAALTAAAREGSTHTTETTDE